MNFGIYIHIPFCKQKCFYCDFASFAPKADELTHNIYRQYIDALCQEMILYRELFPDIYIDTIYFGGGTPSILPADLIIKALHTLQDNFCISPNAEITLEANPGTVTAAKLQKLQQNGINRLSYGVQAVQNELLQKIGRIHTIEEADWAVLTAQQIGFTNISVDLMYGLPGQTLDMLKQSVSWALAKNIQHVSIYGLQIEEGTVFGKLYDEHKLILPTEADSEAMYDYLTQTLPKHGYARYEISNFARETYESKHNLGYWQDKFYLGFGAGAHGYFNGKRVQNPTDISSYIKKCNNHELPFYEEECVDKKAHIEEFCFLGLRMASGVDKQLFKQKFGSDIENIYGNSIRKLVQKGLLINSENSLYLTEKGMKFGNIAFEEFLL